MADQKEVLKNTIQQEALILKEWNDNFFLNSRDTNWIFDFRRIFLQWEFLHKFSCFFWDKYEGDYPFQIWWLELWAVPLISWIIVEWLKRWKNINGFIVRKERKSEWLGLNIEWNINNDKIIIVDDVFNSWKTIEKVCLSIWENIENIFKVFTFVNFGNPKGKDILEKYNLEIEYEFTLSDFWLDSFWNTLSKVKDNTRAPVIYPQYKKIYSWKDPNVFLLTDKSSPLKDGKYIFMWGEGWEFVCICSDTGDKKWSFWVDRVKWHKNILSSPILIKNIVIFWSYDWNLYALDKYTGHVEWIYNQADWIGSSPAYSKKYNFIFIGLEYSWIDRKWSLAAIDYCSWELVWEIFFEDFVHCSPGYNKAFHYVLCGSNDGKVICVNADNWNIIFEWDIWAAIKWWFDFSEDWTKAIFWSFDKKIYCLDLLSWSIDWNFETGNIVYTRPIIIDNHIFVGSLDKNFYHLDLLGRLIKKVPTFWKIFSQPIKIQKWLIVFGSNDACIYFYDYQNKRVRFVIQHTERICTKIIYDEDYKHIYIEDTLNQLFQYDIRGYLD